uniref:Uncharacterized protein n=1 Tax=Arundo donax TaxID=35708 RepID=A0A0A8ZR65_ARUDO
MHVEYKNQCCQSQPHDTFFFDICTGTRNHPFIFLLISLHFGQL